MREILEYFDKDSEDSDPVKKAQTLSARQLPKRFYESVSVEKRNENYAVLLDGRPVKTPARRDLFVPNAVLADMIAREFDLQELVIDPAKMPVTRLVNTVIDGIADDMQAVFEDLLRFVANDMLFYRASTPKELVERQNRAWDPVLDWAADKMGARFILAEGVMHVEQPRDAVTAVSNHLRQIESPYVLAALHTMTTLSGSALLALAVQSGAIGFKQAWDLAHLDEDWTIEHWGEDHEARDRRAYKMAEFVAAVSILAAFNH